MRWMWLRFTSVLLLFPLILIFLCCPLPAWAAVEYFPIPAISSSKNDGNDIGLIVPALVTDPDGELRYIIAPLFVVNSFLGARGTVNVFRYGSRGQALRFVGSYTEVIERRLTLDYIDPAFGQGRFSLKVGGGWFKNATKRFYGFGQGSTEDDETNYTGAEFGGYWQFGLHFNEVTQIALSQRVREVEVQPGAPETDLPFTLREFPNVPGGDGATILGHRVTFFYDSRDSLVTPSDGSQAIAYAELNYNFQNKPDPLYFRYRLEAKKLFPSESKRAILVVRGDLQATFGEDVPFYELSSLGGQNNLRGYGEDRFIDKQLVSFNAEQRLHILRARLFNVDADFEIAPFVDVGRVFNTFKDLQLFSDIEVTPGIGFRGIVRPNVVGRVDYGYSDEGGAVFAGLDYPF